MYSKRSMCVRLIYCCLSLIYIMATGKQESDKQRFRLCASPCPRFITGGDTHSLCVACLGAEHAMRELIVFACLCDRSAPEEHSLKRALSPVLLAVLVPLSRCLKSRGSQVALTERLEMGMSFSPSSPTRSRTEL